MDAIKLKRKMKLFLVTNPSSAAHPNIIAVQKTGAQSFDAYLTSMLSMFNTSHLVDSGTVARLQQLPAPFCVINRPQHFG